MADTRRGDAPAATGTPSAANGLADFRPGFSAEDGLPDLQPGFFALFTAAVCVALAWGAATEWRAEWAARTAFGRVALLATLPLRLLSAAVFGLLAVAAGAIAAVEWGVSEAPSRVVAAYRRRGGPGGPG